MKRWWPAGVATVFLILGVPVGGATSFEQTAVAGSVQRVVDGDTVVVLTGDGERTTVRLAGIDAPELKMPFGVASRRALQGLLEDRTVQLRLQKKDKYGRWVGVLLVNGEDINLKMVALGWAWHYSKYAREQGSEVALGYAKAEQSARLTQSGLWHDHMPTPPWFWRQECSHKQPKNPICARLP